MIITPSLICSPNWGRLAKRYCAVFVWHRWHTRAQRNGLYLDEHEACYFFRQFIEAVQYCHVNHVAHRDLKLDNTLLDSSDPPYIKIADFGFAKDWGDTEANMYT